MKIYFPILFILMAIFFLYIGLKVVIQKRPLLISSRYFFAFMVLAFSPQFVNPAIQMRDVDSGGLSLILLLGPIMFICLLAFFWIQMKGYMLIGIHDESFREALHFSLNQNGMPFDERLSVVALTEEGADLQVAIQSWIGVGQLKLKKSKKRELLKTVVDGINTYYSSNSIKPNNVTSIFYIIIGIFMVICATIFLFIFSKI